MWPAALADAGRRPPAGRVRRGPRLRGPLILKRAIRQCWLKPDVPSRGMLDNPVTQLSPGAPVGTSTGVRRRPGLPTSVITPLVSRHRPSPLGTVGRRLTARRGPDPGHARELSDPSSARFLDSRRRSLDLLLISFLPHPRSAGSGWWMLLMTLSTVLAGTPSSPPPLATVAPCG